VGVLVTRVFMKDLRGEDLQLEDEKFKAYVKCVGAVRIVA
jgi:hypothetical protein